jgi:hypothetical protein
VKTALTAPKAQENRTANPRFSNTHALFEFAGRIFPTPEIKSLFKVSHKNHLQRATYHLLIYHTRTKRVRGRKISLLFLSFSSLVNEKGSFRRSPKLYLSNIKFENRTKPYTGNKLLSGIRGLHPHPTIARALRAANSWLIHPHTPAVNGQVPATLRQSSHSYRFYTEGLPEIPPTLPPGNIFRNIDDHHGHSALVSRRRVNTLKFEHEYRKETWRWRTSSVNF